jgi:hypothetical protein
VTTGGNESGPRPESRTDDRDSGQIPYEPPVVAGLDPLEAAVAVAEAAEIIRRVLSSSRAETDPRLYYDARRWFDRHGRIAR